MYSIQSLQSVGCGFVFVLMATTACRGPTQTQGLLSPISPKPVLGGNPTDDHSDSLISSDLDPAKTPAQNFELESWKITLPIDSKGTFAGAALEKKPIPHNFLAPPYFYTEIDGGMVFYAPTDGATTGGSHYPRSELREMNDDGSEIAWTIQDGGVLRARLSVDEVPKTDAGLGGRVIVGQIHGPDDELCRLYYDNGNIYFYDDKSGAKPKETLFQLLSPSRTKPQIPKRQKFSYEIRVDPSKNILEVSVTDASGTMFTAVDPLSEFWKGKALYFKAGAYVQVSPKGSTHGTGGGKVVFYDLPKPTH